MLYVRALLVTGLLAAWGCATTPKPADAPAEDVKALGERISRICALPEGERTAELEKLKQESGMVLYCGK